MAIYKLLLTTITLIHMDIHIIISRIPMLRTKWVSEFGRKACTHGRYFRCKGQSLLHILWIINLSIIGYFGNWLDTFNAHISIWECVIFPEHYATLSNGKLSVNENNFKHHLLVKGGDWCACVNWKVLCFHNWINVKFN